MEEIGAIICLKKKKQKLKEYQKIIVKLIKAESVNLIKKMSDYMHNKLLILVIFFLISLCTVVAQKYSFRDAFRAFSDTFLIGCKKNTKMERKLTKYVLLCIYYQKLL